jgi:hypothetical protein
LQLKKAGLDGLASHALAALPPDLLRSRPTDAPQVAEMAVELEQNEIATHLLRAIDLASLPAEFLETLLN